MKLFRRLQPGENPDTEIGRFLTEVAHFSRIAPFLGDIRSVAQDGSETGEATTLAMLQGLIQNEGDGWQWTLEELSRYFDSCATCPIPQEVGSFPSFSDGSSGFRDSTGTCRILPGRRGVAGATDCGDASCAGDANREPGFPAEAFRAEDLAADASRIEAQITRSLEALRRGMPTLLSGASESSDSDSTPDLACADPEPTRELLATARLLTSADATLSGKRIRIHGDYHLGQTLRAKSDFVILDFEGEPARSLEERRAKQSPLRDVAGMLRSFSYAAYAGLNAFTQRRPPHGPNDAKALEAWTQLWLNSASTEFLRAYKTTIAEMPRLIPEPVQAQQLLNAYLLEKALYELLYELNNRPTWVRIPLAGILALPD